MCRLTVYKGRSILIGDIVITPENSLLYQSRDAAYHPGVIDKAHQRNILVNGDGFGVSWYGSDPTKGSCCFKFVTPAWSDTNLRNIGRHVSSELIFAHVRAAASGHNPFEPMIVSNENCHPFTYKDYTFMHNGGIPSFQTIKLKVLNLLSPETLANIKGTTDTEHIFAIYLNCLPHREEGQQHTVMEMVDAMNQTISIVLQLCAENGITEHCSLNLCVTNGVHVIATRFRSGPKAPPSLYYNIGANFVCRNGHFYAEDATSATEIVISSAPLSKVCHHQEVEQDASFAEDGEPMSGLGTPTGRSSLGGVHRTASSTGIRPNLSTNSLRALLAPSAQAQSLAQDQGDATDNAETDGDSDIGSWILIPRNHMLVCQGNAQEPHKLESVYLEHIVVRPSQSPLKYPLNGGKRKTESAVPAAAQWAAMPGADLPLSGTAAEQPLQKRQCTRTECTFTLGDQDLSDATTTLSACTSVSSTDGLARQDSTGSDSCTGAVPRTGCVGVAFSPNCKLKPKVIKFTCQM